MSAPEFVVDLEPGSGTSLRVSVSTDSALIGDEVERPILSLPPGDIDELRSGSCSARLAETLAEQVTNWLLKDDLSGHLRTALRAVAEPLRLVIRPHPKVLPDLAEVPYELLKLGDDPLAFVPQVLGIVHTLKDRRPAPAPVQAPRWPFRVLIVRTNPADLHSEVPPALPLRDHILNLAAARGLGEVVEVTTLSSEAGGSGPATYDALRDALRSTNYSVLVYLGHGDLQDLGNEDLPPIGVLQFERVGSPYPDTIRADQIRMELQNRQVPVVIVAGCLTAASDAARRQVPQWMRGCQSVAQALVYGDSGVRCAIGMRYRLETIDADRFLRAFFRSLLGEDAPGDVDRAVRAGREELYAQKTYPPSWSAPVLFRAASAGAPLDFLSSAPGPTEPLDEHDERMRRETWKVLSGVPLSLPPDVRAFPGRLLGMIESTFLERWKSKRIAVLWPARLDARPGEIVKACIQNEGPLPPSTRLEGRLSFPEVIVPRAARASPALRAAGFRALFELDQPGEVRFSLCNITGVPAALPAGPLVEIELAVPAAFPAVYDLRLDCLESDPAQIVRGWSNAIVVSPP